MSTAERSWDVDVDFGPYARRLIPLAVSLPVDAASDPSIAMASLFSAHRQRPIPCQIEVTSNGTWLHWLGRSSRPHETARYRLVAGARQRQAPARIALDNSPTGWNVQDGHERTAEIPAPLGLAPPLVLHGPNGPIGVINPMARERHQPTLHRSLACPIATWPGIVLARMSASYRYHDVNDRCVLTETLHITFHASESETRIIDLVVTWSAETQPIVLHHSDPTVFQTLPGLEVRMFGNAPGRWINGAGKVLTPNGLPEIANGWTFERDNVGLSILTRSMIAGFPLQASAGDARSLDITPRLPEDVWIPAGIRLALGERLTASYRIVLGHAAPPFGSLAEFDDEPVISVRPSAREV